MTLQEIESELLAAGSKFDGHVTNGSMAEQMKVVRKALAHIIGQSIVPPSTLKILSPMTNHFPTPYMAPNGDFCPKCGHPLSLCPQGVYCSSNTCDYAY